MGEGGGRAEGREGRMIFEKLRIKMTFLVPINPFRTKTPNIYSQQEIHLYCIIKLATYKFLYFHYKSVLKLEVLCRQNKI